MASTKAQRERLDVLVLSRNCWSSLSSNGIRSVWSRVFAKGQES